MPIKREYNVDEQWFIDYTPVDILTATLAEEINQMISYNVAPLEINTPIVYQYPVGAVQNGDLFQVTVRNLTQNSVLDISAKFNNVLLRILNDNNEIMDSDSITLSRGETKSFRVFLRKDEFDSYTERDTDTIFQLVVSHKANGEVILRDEKMVSLELASLEYKTVT